MVISIRKLEEIIKVSFPDADVQVIDFVGDNNHYRLKVKSNFFLGKTKVEQHKMIYKVLSGYSIHALQIETGYKGGEL